MRWKSDPLMFYRFRPEHIWRLLNTTAQMDRPVVFMRHAKLAVAHPDPFDGLKKFPKFLPES
jgi:hypothetical protein